MVLDFPADLAAPFSEPGPWHTDRAADLKIDYTVVGAGKKTKAGELIYCNRKWRNRPPVIREKLW